MEKVSVVYVIENARYISLCKSEWIIKNRVWHIGIAT